MVTKIEILDCSYFFLTRICSIFLLQFSVNRTIAGSSKPAVKVIEEARHICSPIRQEPTIETRDIRGASPGLQEGEDNERESRLPESSSLRADSDPGISHPAFPPLSGNSDFNEESPATTTTTATKGGPIYPPFPCPFCDRAYTSWGFRRRHIKAVHTISPKLNCKWCLQVLPTHAAWRRHVISAHNLSASDAHNGLLILEEAHMVLQIAHPTRLDTLVNIIKQSSQQNSAIGDSAPQPD